VEAGFASHAREDVPQRAGMAKDLRGPDGGRGKHLIEQQDCDFFRLHKHLLAGDFNPNASPNHANVWRNYLPTLAYLPSCCKLFFSILWDIEQERFAKLEKVRTK
jgi:hypothetical protein